MDSLSFSYQDATNRQFFVKASFTPSKEKKSKDEIQNSLSLLIKKFIAEHPEVKDSIEIKVRKDLLSAQARFSSQRKWLSIQIEPGEKNEGNTLTRVYDSKIDSVQSAQSKTIFGKILQKILNFFTFLFFFITKHKPSFPVDITLLKEVIGAFPEHGKLSIQQALSYWTKVLEKESLPSKETQEILTELNFCNHISQKIQTMQAKENQTLKTVFSLLYHKITKTEKHLEEEEENQTLDTAFSSLRHEITNTVEHLEEGKKILVPAGFWGMSENKSFIFKDCLIEITRSSNTKYQVSFYSPDAKENNDTSKTYITTEQVDLEHIKKDIPIILALQLKSPTPSIKKETSISEVESQTKEHVTTSHKLCEVLKHTSLSTPEINKATSFRSSRYASTARVVKNIVKKELTTDKTNEISIRDYKITRLSSEVDLLYKATQGDSWLTSDEYRDVVRQSTLKLLSDIAGVRKKGTSLGTIVTQKNQELEALLAKDTQALQDILDQLSAFEEKRVEQSTTESIKSTFSGNLSLPHIMRPKSTKKMTQVTDSFNIAVACPPTPLTKDNVQAYLSQASTACMKLIEQGRFSEAEKIVTTVGLSIPIYEKENVSCPPKHLRIYQDDKNTNAFFLQSIDPETARDMLNSITVLQKSVFASHLAQQDNRALPSLCVALLSLETTRHQLTSKIASANGQKAHFYFNESQLDILCNGKMSFIHAPNVVSRINDLRWYTNWHNQSISPIPPLRTSERCLQGDDLPSNIPESMRTYVETDREVATMDSLVFLGMNSLDYYKPLTDSQAKSIITAAKKDRDSVYHLFGTSTIDPYTEKFIKPFSTTRSRAFQGSPPKNFKTLPSIQRIDHRTTIASETYVLTDLCLSPPGICVNPFNFKYKDSINDIENKTHATAIRQISPKLRENTAENEEQYIYTPVYDDARNEFSTLIESSSLSEKFPCFSTQELYALQSLSPKFTNLRDTNPGCAEAMIANCVQLMEQHPRLFSEPRAKNFIYRNLLRPDVLDSSYIRQSMELGITFLRSRLDTMRKEAREQKQYTKEIYLLSLSEAIALRMGEKSNVLSTLISGEDSLESQARKSAATQYPIYQEYLRIASMLYTSTSAINFNDTT